MLLFTQCHKDKDTTPQPVLTSEQQIMAFMDTIMHNIYYWYDSVPNLDYHNYTSASDYLEALRYKKRDRWSFMLTATEANQIFTQGVDQSYGFMLAIDQSNNAYVALVYDNSPMYQAGIRRAYRLLKVNNTDVGTLILNNTLGTEVGKSSNRFLFADTLGNNVDVTVAMASFNVKTVLYHSIITSGSKKIGYLVLNSFITPTISELDAAFREFSQGQVNEFILDLRYNGGGLVDVAKKLSEYFIPASGNAQPAFSFQFNRIYASRYDTTENFARSSLALNINRLFVITSSGTASASELVINSLRPYMTVKLVGSHTHGKPDGMSEFDKNGYAIFPIIFKLINANGYGDYFGGLPVDYQSNDGITKQWGNSNEDCLKAAVTYITTGSYTKSSILEPQLNYPQLSGVRQQLGCY